MMTKTLTEHDQQKVQLLLQFLDIARKGTVKPFDAAQYLSKLDNLEKEDKIDVGRLRDCCPPEAEVADCKDFRPYILASLEEYASLMGIDADKYKKKRDDRNYRYRN